MYCRVQRKWFHPAVCVGGFNFISHNLLIRPLVFKPLTFILNLQGNPGPPNPEAFQVCDEEIHFLHSPPPAPTPVTYHEFIFFPFSHLFSCPLLFSLFFWVFTITTTATTTVLSFSVRFLEEEEWMWVFTLSYFIGSLKSFFFLIIILVWKLWTLESDSPPFSSRGTERKWSLYSMLGWVAGLT